jgi:rRNA maturation endonuclease Nob1
MEMRMGNMAMSTGSGISTSTATDSTANDRKFCTQCGTPTQSTDRFCSSCGHKLGSD